jgi:hypothetical protein
MHLSYTVFRNFTAVLAQMMLFFCVLTECRFLGWRRILYTNRINPHCILNSLTWVSRFEIKCFANWRKLLWLKMSYFLLSAPSPRGTPLGFVFLYQLSGTMKVTDRKCKSIEVYKVLTRFSKPGCRGEGLFFHAPNLLNPGQPERRPVFTSKGV